MKSFWLCKLQPAAAPREIERTRARQRGTEMEKTLKQSVGIGTSVAEVN